MVQSILDTLDTGNETFLCLSLEGLGPRALHKALALWIAVAPWPLQRVWELALVTEFRKPRLKDQ